MIEYNFLEIPVIDIVNQIVFYAYKEKASDIHFDPREDGMLVRMRIDGNLIDHTKIPQGYEKNVVIRLKNMAKMNLGASTPQDNTMTISMENQDIHMHVATLPTNVGEKVVIHMLYYSSELQDLSSLGFSKENLQSIREMIKCPSGLLLVVGGPGSGKSTTLYALLQELNPQGLDIVTVEEPIEASIDGINQVNMNQELGLTYSSIVRSALKQDPDVIAVGDIPDRETLDTLVHAAQTGHLIIASLARKSAKEALSYLFQLTSDHYSLSNVLIGIVFQRLSRRLCEDCKGMRPTTEKEKELFSSVLRKEVLERAVPVGCPSCGNDGYDGRVALQEVLWIPDHLKDLLAQEKEVTQEEIKRMLYQENSSTILQDALRKVEEGQTTLEEIYDLVSGDSSLTREAPQQKVPSLEKKEEDLEVIDAFQDNEEEEEEEEILDVFQELERITEEKKPKEQENLEVIDVFSE